MAILRCNTIRCNTIRYDAIRYDTIRYDTHRIEKAHIVEDLYNNDDNNDNKALYTKIRIMIHSLIHSFIPFLLISRIVCSDHTTCLGGNTAFSASSVSSSNTLWTTSLTFFSIPSANWSQKSMHLRLRLTQ